MKKILALTLAGTMALSMPVLAATSPTADSYSTSGAAAVSAVTASSVPQSVVKAAADENKTIGEYMNNAVTEVPGLEEVVPLGQGGHVIINGVPSNQTFSVLKPVRQDVDSAKAHAASLSGKVLNVAQVKASVTGFDTAQVNFYLKGLKSGQNVKVYQLVDGVWVELSVAEVRDDHVVVDMTSLGTLAFVELPAAAAQAE
ncbi:hypothetical protein D5282_24455 [bacterium 1xD8-48]|nr:hypothetical protein [Lachnospiraceae bacterium]MCI9327150.1 hypothetical protein [Lachnospiraceae bacterium]NBK00323.1 hypothetical protein [bacterium 1xD8-48]